MITHRTVPGLLIAVFVTVALVSVALTVVGLRRDPAPQGAHATDPAPVAQVRPEVDAAGVLAAWDTERGAAWAAGDVRRLRSLYTSGSVAGRRDAAMLRRWLDRDLVVTGLRTQVLSLHELHRSADRWVLTVTDRVVGGVAIGATTQPLPRDAPSTRAVTLRLVGDEWLVASVRPG